MLELEVVLDFRCCWCSHDMGVTLKCESKGSVKGLNLLTCIKIPCPTCDQNNQIYFTPKGTLHYVAPDRKSRIPEPSRN